MHKFIRRYFKLGKIKINRDQRLMTAEEIFDRRLKNSSPQRKKKYCHINAPRQCFDVDPDANPTFNFLCSSGSESYYLNVGKNLDKRKK